MRVQGCSPNFRVVLRMTLEIPRTTFWFDQKKHAAGNCECHKKLEAFAVGDVADCVLLRVRAEAVAVVLREFGHAPGRSEPEARLATARCCASFFTMIAYGCAFLRC